MTTVQAIARRMMLPGSALTGSNLYDAIALSIAVGGILALTPIVLSYYRAEFPSFIAQPLLIVGFYLYVRSFRLLEHYRGWPERLLLLASFTIPLEQMFFPNALAKLLWRVDSHLALQLLRGSNILLLAVTVLALRNGGLARALRATPFLIKTSFVIGVASFALATVFSTYPLQSLAGGLLELFPVYCAIFAFAAIAPDDRFIRHACLLFVLACLGVAAAQIIAVAPTLCCGHAFYLRAMVPEFVAMRDRLDEMQAVQINGYGNVLHYGSLAVLIIPVVAGSIYSRDGGKLAIPVLLAIVYSFLLVYSRAGMVVLSLGLILSVLFLLSKHRVFGTTLVALMVFIVFAHASREVLDYHLRGVSTLASHIASSLGASRDDGPPAAKPAGVEPAAVEPVTAAQDAPQHAEPAAVPAPGDRVAIGAGSADARANAWQLGLDIAMKNWPTGVGYAVYRLVEPVYTAPHSLLLKRWAEGGILGAISILLLAAYPFLALGRTLLERQPSIFRFACLLGVCGFFLQAMLFGADFSVMGLIVWGYGVGLLIAASQANSRQSALRS